jgi:hypothetical protein
VSASALLFATAPAADGGAAAALPAAGTTLLGRLLDQLGTLGVRRAWVVTRPAWAPAVREAVAGAGLPAEVVEAEDVAGDLRIAADLAARARETLLVGRGDVLLHREVLAGLMADPKIVTGIVNTSSREGGRWAFRTRSARGRVLSASSPYHRVRRPNGHFLGFLKVDRRDLPQLGAAAARLAELSAAPPADWELELERKAGDWRRWLWMHAEEDRTGRMPAPEDAPEVPPLDADDEHELAERLRVSREDAAALLVVGLVRTGVHVGNTYLRTFYYGRPRSRAAVAEAEQAMAARDEDKMALASAVKATDGFFTTFFVSPYSRYIARFAARRGWTPNQMTSLSMVLGVIAAVAFAQGTRAGLISGAVLVHAAFTIDCVDGQLARYTRQFSKLGAWLDSVFDRGKEYVVYAGLAIGATRMGQDVWTLACAAITLQTARHAVDFSWGATRHQVIAAQPHLPLERADEIEGGPEPVARPRPASAGGDAVPASGGAVPASGASGAPAPAPGAGSAVAVVDPPPLPATRSPRRPPPARTGAAWWPGSRRPASAASSCSTAGPRPGGPSGSSPCRSASASRSSRSPPRCGARAPPSSRCSRGAAWRPPTSSRAAC